jgi:tetratricopeptide (TPR) repeat protein
VANGRFSGQLISGLDQSSSDLSVRRFGGGRGLSILRLTESKAPSPDDGEWLAQLIGLLQPILPQLQLDCPDVSGEVAASAAPTNAEPPPSDSRSSPPTEPQLASNQPPAHLVQAAAALERTCFRDAERFGRLAAVAKEENATEFLELVRVIRRGSKLIRRSPRDAVVRLELAQAYFLADAGRAATREATEALRLDPTLGEAHALLGLEHLYQGERDQAQAAWEQARTLSPMGGWQQSLARSLRDHTVEVTPTTCRRMARHQRGWRSLAWKCLAQVRGMWERSMLTARVRVSGHQGPHQF